MMTKYKIINTFSAQNRETCNRKFTFYSKQNICNDSAFIETAYYSPEELRIKRFIIIPENWDFIDYFMKCSLKATGQRGYKKIYYTLQLYKKNLYYCSKISTIIKPLSPSNEIYYFFVPNHITSLKGCVCFNTPILTDAQLTNLLLGLQYDI